MSVKDAIKGFALVCQTDGRIKTVASDPGSIFAGEVPAENLASLGSHSSSGKFLDFIALLNKEHKAVDWVLNLDQGSERADYSLSGIKHNDDLYVIGTMVHDHLKEAKEYISTLHDAGSFESGHPFKIIEEMISRRISGESGIYDELARLNNELINLHRELTKNNRQLQDALNDVKTLKGLIPICASCKKIRDGEGYWQQVEEYVARHTEAEFSHGLCDECAHKLYPDYFPDQKNEEKTTPPGS